MNLSKSNLRKVVILLTAILTVSLLGKYLLDVWTNYEDCYNTMSHKAYSRFSAHEDYRAECWSRTMRFPANY